MAAQEPIPAAGAEHLHVRPDRPGGGLCHLHGVPAEVLHPGASAARPAPEAVVNGPALSALRRKLDASSQCGELPSTTMEGFVERARQTSEPN